MPLLPASIRALLLGDPFGEVWPEQPSPYRPFVDGRTAALRALKKYIAALTFYRAGNAGGPPIAFQMPPDDIVIEWPDNEKQLALPSLVVEPALADFLTIGLVSQLDETSRDRFGLGTVLQVQSEYNEKIVLKVVAASKAERRSLLAGLQVALVPTETLYGLRLRMPDYFDEPVCFTLWASQLMDSEDSGRNRRTANLTIEMRFNVVALVRYATLRPVVVLEDAGDEIAVTTTFGAYGRER